MQPFGHNRHGPKIGGLCPLFLGRGSWVGSSSSSHNVAWAVAYLHTMCHLHPCSRLATIDMGQKLGGGSATVLGREELGPHLT